MLGKHSFLFHIFNVFLQQFYKLMNLGAEATLSTGKCQFHS